MLASLFPELKNSTSKSEREASIKYSLLASEVVCNDLIRLYDQGKLRYGKGILVMRMHKGSRHSTYLTEEDIAMDYDIAKSSGNTSLASSLKEIVTLIKDSNTDKCALLMRVDNSGLASMRIDRENPTGCIEGMMEEISS
jgi:hypothetical protein